jgi:hypothetical protein
MTTYHKPTPSACLGASLAGHQVEASDRIIDAQYRRFNGIVDKKGWKQANSVAYATLFAVIWWLASVHGNRKVYELVSVCADELMNESLTDA